MQPPPAPPSSPEAAGGSGAWIALVLMVFVGLWLLYVIFLRCWSHRFTAPLCFRLSSAGTLHVNGTYWLIGSFEGAPMYLHENKQVALLGLRDLIDKPPSRRWHLVELANLERLQTSYRSANLDLYSASTPKATDTDPPTKQWCKRGGEEPPPVVENAAEPDGVRSLQREAYHSAEAAETRAAAAKVQAARRREHEEWVRRQWEERRRAAENAAWGEAQRRAAQEARQRAYHRSILPAAAPRVG